MPPNIRGEPGRPNFFLSFDPGTKTFAWSLSRVELGEFLAARAAIAERIAACGVLLGRARRLAAAGDDAAAAGLLARLAPAVAAADAQSRSFLTLFDGEAVDLVPGRADSSVSSVERVRAVAAYVGARIRPALARLVPPGARLRVLIEYQMGPNAPARKVAFALLTLFIAEEVCFVGPALKNDVDVGHAASYVGLAAQYRTLYGQNKAHARAGFAQIEAAFGTRIAPSRPPALRSHIADSFMQVLGHLIHGPAGAAAFF